MAIKTSTGLRSSLLSTGSLRSVLNLGFINIYAGDVPASADAALGSATLLVTISNASTATGLTLEATATAGVIAKEPSEVWSGVNGASGVASFYRHVAPGDDGLESTEQARIQGTAAVFGGDMNLTSTTLTSGATQTIDFYTLSLPTA